MGDILCKVISQECNTEPLFFHGSLTVAQREELIEKFQTDKDTKVMILSLKAGGTGLNLTSATNVIHYDLWWNPAVEDQATDRTYRIGQDKNVMVHRMITLGTFEEKIDEMLKSKKKNLLILPYTKVKRLLQNFQTKKSTKYLLCLLRCYKYIYAKKKLLNRSFLGILQFLV